MLSVVNNTSGLLRKLCHTQHFYWNITLAKLPQIAVFTLTKLSFRKLQLDLASWEIQANKITIALIYDYTL